MLRRMILPAMLLMAANTMAVSADLGGNCCSDLEERIAELEATTARKGNRKVSLTVSGQINYAVVMTDIDGSTKTKITDNPNSMSRFRFVGDAKIGQSWTAGYLMEIGLSNAAGFDGVAKNDFNIRHSALWISGPLGKLTIGKTSTATDGIMEMDLSNASVASTMLSLEPLSGTWLGGFGIPLDGGRAQVLRYDTPTMAGFTATASRLANVDNSYDLALRYAGEAAGFRLIAGIGHRKDDAAKMTGGSASLMHVVSGLFVNGSYGQQTNGAFTSIGAFGVGFTPALSLGFDKLVAYHVQGGIERKWLDFGKTTIFGEYLNVKIDGEAVDGWGLGVVQGIDAASMDLYVGYRRYDDLSSSVLTAGGVVRF